MIPFSAAILDDLKSGSTSGAELCILGDTSYGSCCVDEVSHILTRPDLHNDKMTKILSLEFIFQVAAMHINADAIIHFGHACLSKVSRLPVHYVFLHFKFDATKFSESFHKRLPNHDEPILVFYSNGLFYQLGEDIDWYIICKMCDQVTFFDSFSHIFQIISNQHCLVIQTFHLPNWHSTSKRIIWHGDCQKLIYQRQLAFGLVTMIKHCSI